ncbi:hypothetical protein [Pseudomonas sp. AKS31]|uniref:hypothetical protein n=1 Tax=Pseudomonas sp. AKS31 TaxID=2949091 RepID=UPI002029C7AD|nr:hypothetical protein [Pseudomonas sp. AKS31]MCL9802561.1 hypothetical protein [Pseudomonas sp. AKS31]
MKSKEILDLEVALLFLRYGRKTVFQAIARHEHLSEGEIQREIEALFLRQHGLAVKKRNAVKQFHLNSVLSSDDEKNNLLQELYAKFENRTFLPELKDVKRFFDRYGKDQKNLKSRASAQSVLFRFLANLEVVELKKILATPVFKGEFSSLGLISDEILRNSISKRSDEPT